MKTVIRTLLVLISLSLTFATATYAYPVHVTYKGYSSTNTAVRSNAVAGFYNLSIDGGETILGMCDDYSTHVHTGADGWNAQRYNYQDIITGSGRWGDGESAGKYNVIGYLFMQTYDENADRGLLADINQAIWNVYYNLAGMTDRATQLYTEAMAHTNFTGWYGWMDILTPEFADGKFVSQEFLVRSVNPAPVPEPATMLLFGTGLIGLAGFGRRKLKKH